MSIMIFKTIKNVNVETVEIKAKFSLLILERKLVSLNCFIERKETQVWIVDYNNLLTLVTKRKSVTVTL